MKIIYFIFSFLCAALSLPVFDLININTNLTEESKVYGYHHIYTTKNEILNILIPRHFLTYAQNLGWAYDQKKVLFIIESNNGDANIISVYKGNVTKLIEGNDVTETIYGENIYIATNNGIQSYKDDKTEKYGTLNDTFINIAFLYNTDLYAIGGDKKLYRIVNNGTKKETVNEVIDAERMVVDKDNNIYYQNSNNEVFVYNYFEGIRNVEGLPNNITKLKVMKALRDDGGVFITTDKNLSCFINCNENCTAKCDTKTETQFLTSFALARPSHWYLAVKNSVFEYDYLRTLGPVFTGTDVGSQKP